MKVLYQKENQDITIYLKGELGNFEARQAMHEIENILSLYEKEDVSVDLSHLTFMDSSGIAVVMKIFKNTKGKRKFTIKNTPSTAMKIFSASGVSKFVNFV